MSTNQQEALAHQFLLTLDPETRPLYHEIMMCLAEYGYHPRKEGSNLSFKTALHGKQIAKMGTRRGKTQTPFFALRFSGCGEYTQKFADVIKETIIKYPSKAARCTSNLCSYCGGWPDTHVYAHTFPDGERKAVCGAYALEIPNISADDIGEIKRLIREEHEYLYKHEVEAKN